MRKLRSDIRLVACFFAVAILLFPIEGVSQPSYFDTAIAVTEAPPVTDSAAIAEEEFESSEVREGNGPFITMEPGYQDSISWRNLPEGYIAEVEKDRAFDYVKNGIPKPVQKEVPAFKFNTTFLYFIIAAFVIFLLWYLINNHLIDFKRKAGVTEQSGTDGAETEDIFSIQYRDAIQNALQQKNYRLAIRLQYLQLLKTLSDRKKINYRPDKTNFDYLMQLQPTDYYNEFLAVTRNYEYSWYGLFDVTAEMYQKMEERFLNFQKQLK